MIKNLSKNSIITPTFLYKRGFAKTTGLLFETNPESIVFNTRFGIHTFFMKFPIDLIILDKKRRVVFLEECIKPNRVVFWNPKYNLVLELPAGSINKSKTKLNDILKLSL